MGNKKSKQINKSKNKEQKINNAKTTIYHSKTEESSHESIQAKSTKSKETNKSTQRFEMLDLSKVMTKIHKFQFSLICKVQICNLV